MEVLATHYICIKDKEGKDILVMRRGDKRVVTKKELALLEKEAAGKFQTAEEK
jgi:hypothetical protein